LIENKQNLFLNTSGFKISPVVRKAAGFTNNLVSSTSADINLIISSLHSELDEQIACRKFFYRNAPLVKEGFKKPNNQKTKHQKNRNRI